MDAGEPAAAARPAGARSRRRPAKAQQYADFDSEASDFSESEAEDESDFSDFSDSDE